MALGVLVSFVLYLRPGELLRITSKCLVRPSSTAPWWGVILHPVEDVTPGKVGLTDESLLCDQAAHGQRLGEFLSVLANLPPDSQFLGLRPGDLKRCWSETLSSMQVDKYDLYQLRHGGASFDLLQRNRSPLEVKLRLRHTSDSSLARYGKATRAQKEAGNVEPAVQALGNYVLQNIAHVFHNPRSLPIELVRSADSKAN